MTHRSDRVYPAVSLFSNCGAGDLGFKTAGFRFQVLAELKTGRLAIAQRNHPYSVGVEGDLRRTWERVVDRYHEQALSQRLALLSACPPCQGMSSAYSDRGDHDDPDAGSDDPRNLLVLPIANVASALEPRVVVVENVTAFLIRKVRHPETHEPVSAARLLISELSDDYAVFPIIVDLADYGVPQSRKRTFLTFVHREEPWLAWLRQTDATPYPTPTHADDPIVLKEALRRFDLPSLDASTPADAQDPDRRHHFVPVWQDRRYPMVDAIPSNSGASAWENDECSECGEVDVGEDDAVCPECGGALLRPVVAEDDGFRLVKGFHSSYRRMSPSAPAPTVTTASGHLGSDRTVHPWENRLLSPLECALLQTIPESFDWGDALDDEGVTELRRMIGEAVPPKFTGLHGEVVASLMDGDEPDDLLPSSDRRVRKARRKLANAAEGTFQVQLGERLATE